VREDSFYVDNFKPIRANLNDQTGIVRNDISNLLISFLIVKRTFDPFLP
jgi:hypothetical protein